MRCQRATRIQPTDLKKISSSTPFYVHTTFRESLLGLKPDLTNLHKWVEVPGLNPGRFAFTLQKNLPRFILPGLNPGSPWVSFCSVNRALIYMLLRR